MFDAEKKIVPGIPSLEVLPEPLVKDPSYVFAGPLIMEDRLIERVNKYASAGLGSTGKGREFTGIRRYFESNEDRFTVYFTFGNVAKATPEIVEAIRFLLDNDAAVITNIDIGGLKPGWEQRYFFQSYLPMHLVCSNADLMIHHCGSGTYQYSILHQVPSITIGTRCFDREEVALRLEKCGVSRHIPSPDEITDFVPVFKKTAGEFFDRSGTLYRQAKRNLAKLKEETERVTGAFDFERVLEQTVSSTQG